MVLTGSHDKTARLWDVATGKTIGPPLRHPHPVHRVAFWFDGKSIVTGHGEGVVGINQPSELQVRFGQVPTPLEGDPDLIELWVQVVTGMELEANGGVRPLDAAAWQERWQRLKDSGFKGP